MAGVRRDDAAPGADEEVGPECLLELTDLLGDRRLRDPEGPGGSGEAAELQRCAEAAELLERQKLSFGLRQEMQATLMGRDCGSWLP
jgi:hypothetical protein